MRTLGHSLATLVVVAGVGLSGAGPALAGDMDRLDDASLRKILLSAPDDDDREDAAEVLRKRAPTIENLRALLTSLQRDPEKEVREEAAQTLRTIAAGVDFVRQALYQAWVSDPSTRVRKEAGKLFQPLYRRGWFRRYDVDVYRTRYPLGTTMFYYGPSMSYPHWGPAPGGGHSHRYLPTPYDYGAPPPNSGWH